MGNTRIKFIDILWIRKCTKFSENRVFAKRHDVDQEGQLLSARLYILTPWVNVVYFICAQACRRPLPSTPATLCGWRMLFP